jgi:hypothetical protein
VTVIKVIPFIVGHGLAESGVMAEANVSEMVGNHEAVVDQLVLLALLSTKNEFAHVKSIQREIDQGFELGATDSESVFTLTSFETFESNYQNWRSAVDLEGLVGDDVVLAIAAIPFVVFVESLSNSEFLEAVNEINISLALFKVIDLLPSISRR